MPDPKPLAVVLVSGGLDSVTLAHLLQSEGYDLHLLSVYYGQRHAAELRFARQAAKRLLARHDEIDLSTLRSLLGENALTNPHTPVPEGHYADKSMRQTVVPNRNAIMLSIAFGIAAAEGARIVATAVHAGDHSIYPDCRPQFIYKFGNMQAAALDGVAEVVLQAPFLLENKAHIVRVGASLGVPFEETWSCYQPQGSRHCGRCGTCVERREAFQLAGVADPTVYAAQPAEAV